MPSSHSNPAEPLQRMKFETARLMNEHPPRWENRNKKLVFSISSPAGRRHDGTIHYSRWPSLGLPGEVDVSAATDLLEGRPDVFEYQPVVGHPRAVEWHVNFADPHLFVAYGSGLLAQDELQALEHPSLGAVREALKFGKHPALTEENSRATPVLLMGVERRCRFATDRNAAEGRPDGLYGGLFARASEDAVRNATKPIDPPTFSNIIAIAAPMGGHGTYTRAEVERVLVTAYSAYAAARLESERIRGESRPVVVHTGFWGCGVFGGNRELMTLLQAIAAGMAGLDRLVYHTVERDGMEVLDKVRQRVSEHFGGAGRLPVNEVIDRICGMNFEWGIGDAN